MSLVSSLNIAQQALSVNQSAITVVSNNIANVDNENYSKLSVRLAEVVNYTPSAGNAISVANSLSGVQIAGIQRSTDTYLQKYYWQENSNYSYLQQYSSVASNIQDLMNELNDTGLSEALTNFYEAVDSLGDDPTDVTARQNYVSAAENVCYVFNTTYKSLNNIQESLVGDYSVAGSVDSSEIQDQVDQVNTLLDQLSSVNESIIKTNSKDYSSSSLLDERDQIIEQLTSLMPVTVTENSNSTVDISIGDYQLLNSTQVVGNLGVSTGSATQPAVINVVDPNNSLKVLNSNINSSIDSGSIGAILDVCGGATSSNFTVSGVLSQLNTLASTFSAIMNNIQNGDPSGDGSVAMCLTSGGKELQVADEDIFTSSAMDSDTNTDTRAYASGDTAGTTISTAIDDAGNATTTVVTTTINDAKTQTTTKTTTITGVSAGNISVNSDMSDDPYLVAAGRLTADEYANFDNYKTSVGNNDNATLMTNSRNNKYDGLGDLTIENYLSSTVSSVGSKVESIDSDLDNETLVMNEIESNLTSATSVNLDEELVDLVKYQRAYQAAARIFSICNDLLDSLINLGN